ncbi:hypothetical protein ACTHGU_09820 [Chitinophagaceae bacterium MMS25-I14]
MILLFGTTPMEYVHTFTHHKDTVHHAHQHGLSFENKHHHCDFLSFQLLPFDNDIYIPHFYYIPAEYCSTHAALVLSFVQRSIVRTSLRGPPTA